GSLAYSFLGLSLWPRTHRHSTACPAAACTSFCHSGRFSTAPPLRRQPRATQPGTHSFIPLIRYSESDTYVTRALRHCRCSHSSVAMAPASAIRLLVVSGEHSYKSQRATLSPAGGSARIVSVSRRKPSSTPTPVFALVYNQGHPRFSKNASISPAANSGSGSRSFLFTKPNVGMSPATDRIERAHASRAASV